MIRLFFLAITASVVLHSCSIRSLVVSNMEPIFEQSAAAIYEETDYELAGQALAGNLKLLEGLIKSYPESDRLRLLTAEGYAGYALGFIEDEDPQRAKVFYLRARDYALSVLRKNENFIRAEKKGQEAFKTALSELGPKDVPALFWAGFAWAGYINLSLTDPAAIMDMPKVQLIMERVKTLDAAYFHGGVYLFFGSLYGMKPKILGGDPQKALSAFEKNLELTRGKFLITYLYMAKYYAAKILDKELFDSYISKIENTALTILPGSELMNRIAKQKALYLKQQKEDIF